MKVGVYVDGYNLYYGGRGICGRATAGWRWLDLRALAASTTAANSSWPGPFDLRVVFCTARVKGRGNTSGQQDQDTYLRALTKTASADVIELGSYVERIATSPLAVPDRRGRPILTTSQWPLIGPGRSRRRRP